MRWARTRGRGYVLGCEGDISRARTSEMGYVRGLIFGKHVGEGVVR